MIFQSYVSFCQRVPIKTLYISVLLPRPSAPPSPNPRCRQHEFSAASEASERFAGAEKYGGFPRSAGKVSGKLGEFHGFSSMVNDRRLWMAPPGPPAFCSGSGGYGSPVWQPLIRTLHVEPQVKFKLVWVKTHGPQQ